MVLRALRIAIHLEVDDRVVQALEGLSMCNVATDASKGAEKSIESQCNGLRA